MISDALRRRAVELGVDVEYEDVDQVVHDADEAVVERVVEVLDEDSSRASGGIVEPIHLDPRRAIRVAGRVDDVELRVGGVPVAVTTETSGSGGDVVGTISLPDDLPTGCHELEVVSDGSSSRCLVVVAPATMPGADPSELASSLFVPAYALWESDDPLPSFGHLRSLAEQLPRHGVDVLATLPLYATFLDDPFDPSPYSPISRLHWNEVYLDDASLPDAPLPTIAAGGELDWRALAARRRRQLVQAALEAADDVVEELAQFAAAHPDVGSYARFMAERESGGDEVVERSHVLAQYLADAELGRISAADGSAALSLDLPIGSHPDGHETWAHPHLFAESMSVGAPPDTFFTEGQDWGFPPQLPGAMRSSGYELWRQMVARAGRHADMLRIDHVMAVHRLWWIPDGAPADRGVYVRYPHDELLAVIAAEAAAADVAIVGENLGTVPPAVDAALEEWQVLGMHEEQFHLGADRLDAVPPRTVAGVRTHDMAPFATVEVPEGYRSLIGADPDEATLDAVLRRLAASDAQVVVADLDDLLDETRPHNLPGRVVPGIWSRRLDAPLSRTLADERVGRRLRLLERTTR
ncbi:4-alpha-glucanotransferase [Ilumatobacter sp.]|uniref:4-alpha-glucanotransferase n=1 Tax=Ilumatobacter sp. TaxID=1967498 RepID=UPI003B52C320